MADGGDEYPAQSRVVDEQPVIARNPNSGSVTLIKRILITGNTKNIPMNSSGGSRNRTNIRRSRERRPRHPALDSVWSEGVLPSCASRYPPVLLPANADFVADAWGGMAVAGGHPDNECAEIGGHRGGEFGTAVAQIGDRAGQAVGFFRPHCRSPASAAPDAATGFAAPSGGGADLAMFEAIFAGPKMQACPDRLCVAFTAMKIALAEKLGDQKRLAGALYKVCGSANCSSRPWLTMATRSESSSASS